MHDETLNWIKSTSSMGNGACVELASDDDSILVRNSRRPQNHLRCTRAEVAAFIKGAKNGEFDHLVAD
jgi:hypothetical protein